MQSRTASTSSTNRTSNSKLPQEENMTDDKLAALGKKAARAKRWRWLPGMLTTDGLRVLDAPPDAPATPDFSDAPTFGGLVAIFRTTGKDFYIKPAFNAADEQIWEFGYKSDTEYVWSIYSGATQLEALISALVNLQ